MTEKRRAACRRNLARAKEVLAGLGDGSPSYGTHFRRGLWCQSLGRSAAKAGERREDYDHYLKLFDWAVGPEGGMERKLVRGLAGAVWRRLRALHGQAHWERQCLGYRLEQAGRGRYPCREESLRERRDWLADEIVDVLSTDGELVVAVEKSQSRVELLWREVEGRVNPGGPRLGFEVRRRGWGRGRWAAVTEEALGNAWYRSAIWIGQRASGRSRGLDWGLETAGLDEGWGLGGEPELEHLDDERYWRELLTPGRDAWYAPKRCGATLASFEEFARLFERAFESRSRAAKSPASSWASSSAQPVASAAGGEARGRAGKLGRALEATWRRLEFYRERASQERAGVMALLEEAIRARAAGGERGERIRKLATGMVELLGGYGEAMRQAIRLERELCKALLAYRRRGGEGEARQREKGVVAQGRPGDPAAVRQHRSGVVGKEEEEVVAQGRPGDPAAVRQRRRGVVGKQQQEKKREKKKQKEMDNQGT